MRIINSIIGLLIGFLLIKYSVSLTEWLGTMGWAEKYFTTGMAGTYTMYRLIGVIFIVLSLLYLFNLFGFITNPLAPLFGGVK